MLWTRSQRDIGAHASGLVLGMETLVHVAWAHSTPHGPGHPLPPSSSVTVPMENRSTLRCDDAVVATRPVPVLQSQGQCRVQDREWGPAPCWAVASPALPTGNRGCSWRIPDCHHSPIPCLERNHSTLWWWGEQHRGGETGEPTQLQWGWWGPALGVRAVGSAPVPSWAAAGQGLNPGDIPHSHSPGALSTGTGGLASLEFLWKRRYRTAWNSSNHLFFPYL